MPTLSADGHALTICDTCGAYNDEPRHGMAVPGGYPGAIPSDEVLEALPLEAKLDMHAMRETLHPNLISRCMHCCAAGGCLACALVFAKVGELRGAELRAALVSGTAAHLYYDPETGV